MHSFRSCFDSHNGFSSYAGSYSPYHGAELLLDGFACFLGTHPGYTLRFIGNGASRSSMEERARELGIEANIEYLAPVPPSELLPHLGSAIASLASIRPKTVYEYSLASKAYSSLMAGCPVLFTGAGPTIGLIARANEAGVRAGAISDYDAVSIADALASLAEDRITPSERKALSKWSEQEHSLKTVAHRVLNILTEVSGKKR